MFNDIFIQGWFPISNYEIEKFRVDIGCFKLENLSQRFIVSSTLIIQGYLCASRGPF